MLTPIADDLWTAPADLKMGLTRFPTRMVVARLPDGQLWVHSPVRWTEELGGAVDALGSIRYLVAPNTYHHLFINGWKRQYPESALFVTPALKNKRPDLAEANDLSDQHTPWTDQIDSVAVQGTKIGEFVFQHKPSRTLLVSDLVFNVRQHDAWLARMMFRLGGSYGRCQQSRLWNFLVKDKAPYVASLQRILQLEPQALVPAHGEVVPTSATETLRSAVGRWL